MLVGFIFLTVFVTLGFSTCPNGGYEYQSNCYYFNSDAAGFGVAEVYCNNLGGHLAAIHDAFANVVIGQEAQNSFNQSSATDLWIGSSNLILNGKWNWTDGSPLDFNNWKKGEPQNIDGYNCAALTMKDGYWAAQDCYQLKPFACAVPLPAYPREYNCSPGWMYYPLTGSCYTIALKQYNGTWSDAEQYCQYLGGAHLPSIHSFAEAQLLMSYGSALGSNMLTGIFSNDGGQTFEATDGTMNNDYVNYGTRCRTKFAPESSASDKAVKICVVFGIQATECHWTVYCGQMTPYVMCQKRVF